MVGAAPSPRFLCTRGRRSSRLRREVAYATSPAARGSQGMLKRGLVLGSALGLALLSACHKAPAPPRVITPVRVAPAESAPAASAIRYSASLQPMTQVDVSF